MKKLLIPLAIIFFFPTCKTTSTLNIPKIRLDDYTFETTPNSLDKVGYVFAVDKNKTQIPVTNLTIPGVQDGTVTVESSTKSRDLTFGAVLKFLGLEKVNVSADVSIDNNKKIKTTFGLEKPILSRGYLLDLDSVIQSRKEVIKNALINQNLRDARLYVILEVIKTKKLTYDFDKGNVGKAALDANFKEIAFTVGAKASWNSSNKQTLSYEMDNEQTVFFKLFEIDVMSSVAGDFKIKTGNAVKGGELVYLTKQ